MAAQHRSQACRVRLTNLVRASPSVSCSSVEAVLPVAHWQPATPSQSCFFFGHALLQCYLGHAWNPALPCLAMCRPQQALLPLWTRMTAADDVRQQTGRPDMLCGVMQAPVSGQHGPSAAPAEDVQPQLEGAPAPGTIATAAPEPQTALPAPEPAAKSSTYADTTQERCAPALTGACCC